MEAYTAHHADSVEEILHWPWRRFEAFYTAFVKRQVVETLESRKNDMVMALWSNEGFNAEGVRTEAIGEIEAHYKEAIDQITGVAPEEEEIDKDNPFFKPTFEGMEKIGALAGGVGTVEAMIEQESDFTKYIDQ